MAGTIRQLRPWERTPLESVLIKMQDWKGDDRTAWDALRELAKLGVAAPRPRVEPPVWFGRAVQEVVRSLAQVWMFSATFAGVRAAERLGWVSLEHDDTYVLAMVSGLGDRWHPHARPDAVRADAELRESLLWRVFEVEGGGEVSLANVDKYSSAECGWADTFRVLLADRTLPRDRVLDECLRALGRDFSAYRAGWFAQMYRSLEPTPDELVAAQPALRGLMRSSVPATVSFAVAYLKILDKASALIDDEYVAHCAAALGVSTKATPITAIDLAGRVAARRPDLAAAVEAAVAHGLEHPHRDVQTRALTLLRTLDARDAVAARMDLLEPSIQRVAADWLGRPARPALVPPPPQRSAPIQQSTVDSTIAERGAALLAGETDPWEIEQLLASLVAAVDPADEVAPLRSQARKVVANANTTGSLRRRLARVVLAAAGEAEPAPAVRYGVAALHGDLLAGRLAEVIEIVSGRRPPQPLLATPTDPAGWLDPSAFVDRFASLTVEPAHYDLVAALLRVAVEGRDVALAAASALPGEAGTVARFALGGPPGTIRTRSLWVAAARSRAPFDDDPHVIKAGLPGAGAGSAATYGLRFEPDSHRYQERGRTRTVTWWRPTLVVGPVNGTEYADQPTVVAGGELRQAPW